jgi:histone-lysine N-methyltransferase EZH2
MLDAFADICQNAKMQHGRRKVGTGSLGCSTLKSLFQGLEVKEGSWGLGTFLTESVKAGDLLAGAF